MDNIPTWKAAADVVVRYMNEADVLEDDWQQAFYGSNYGRLLDIKRAYDPSGIFSMLQVRRLG